MNKNERDEDNFMDVINRQTEREREKRWERELKSGKTVIWTVEKVEDSETTILISLIICSSGASHSNSVSYKNALTNKTKNQIKTFPLVFAMTLSIWGLDGVHNNRNDIQR